MKRMIFLGIYAVLLFSICGCQEELNLAQRDLSKTNEESTFLFSGISTYPLDWENIDYMPTPPGTPSVLVPWASGTSRQFTAELAGDYKSSDGWTLLYNTFNTSALPDNWYFILYNKYRGLVRLYYYIPSNANYISSANITHKLAIEGSYAPSSPMLNFAGQRFVDVNSNSRFASTVEQWQVARSTWYVFQYELAYDENMANQSYSTFNFLWPLRSSQITNITIDGTVMGSLNGTISLPGSDFTISPTFSIDGSRNKSTVAIKGSSDAEKLKPGLGQTIVNAIKNAITNGAKGIISNILSGIFKRNSSTPEENVNLKIDAKVSLNGQLTSDVLLSSPVFAIPGYNQSSTPGFVPAYNKPLGVFYLSDRPTIDVTYRKVPTPPCAEEGAPDEYYLYKFNIDPNSFQLNFNPAVTGVADIQNIEYDILLKYSRASDILTCASSYREELIIGQGTFYEVFFLRTLFPTFGTGPTLSAPLYLRVSFDVVPKDGNPPVTITKTFVTRTTLQQE